MTYKVEKYTNIPNSPGKKNDNMRDVIVQHYSTYSDTEINCEDSKINMVKKNMVKMNCLQA